MGEFENYQIREDKTEDANYQYYRDQAEKGIGNLDRDFIFEYDADQLEEHFQERIEGSTFEDRTKYYFTDTRVMLGKAKRYRSLWKGEKGDLKAFSKKYTNHRASKRATSARNAMGYFAEARLLEKKNAKNVKDLDAFQLFEHREAIMELRLKGMEASAEVKSRSSEHEKYLKGKAALSCQMILMDQLVNLKEQAGKNRVLLRKFEEKEARLNRKIAATKKTLEKNTPKASTVWQEKSGIKKDAMERNRRKYRRINPNITVEDTEILHSLLALKQNCEVDYPKRIAYQDKNGAPINLAEKNKIEWNEKYDQALAAGDQQLQQEMMLEAIKRVERYNLPSLEDYKKNGVIHYLKQDYAGFYEMVKKAAPYFEAEGRKEGLIKSYIDTHPYFASKLTLLKNMGEHMDYVLSKEHNIKLGKNGFYQVSDGDYGEEKDQLFDDTISAMFHLTEERRKTRKEDEDPRQFEIDGKELQINEDELALSEEEKALKDDETYLNLKSVNKNLTGKAYRIYRSINDADMEDEERKALPEQFSKYFDKFVLPDAGVVNEKWIEENMTRRGEELLDFVKKAMRLEKNEALSEYEYTHPMFQVKRKAIRSLGGALRQFLRKEWHIDIGADLSQCEVIADLEKDKMEEAELKMGEGIRTFTNWRKAYTEKKISWPEFKTGKKSEELSYIRENYHMMSDDSYDYFKALEKGNLALERPLYRRRFRVAEALQKNAVSEKEKITGKAGTDSPGFLMLQSIELTDDWKLKNAEDQKRHEWNEDWSRAYQMGDKETIEKMALEALPNLIEIQLPEADVLADGWLEEQLLKNPMALINTLRRVDAVNKLEKQFPAIAKYREENPELDQKLKAVTALARYMDFRFAEMHNLSTDSFEIAEKRAVTKGQSFGYMGNEQEERLRKEYGKLFKTLKPEEEKPEEEEKPIVEEKPVIVEEKPIIEEEKPVIEEEKPSIEEEKPVIEEEKPVEEEKPLTEEIPKEEEENSTNIIRTKEEEENSINIIHTEEEEDINHGIPEEYLEPRQEEIVFIANTGAELHFIKREPKDLKDALSLRSQITKNLERGDWHQEALGGLFDYYNDYVNRFRDGKPVPIKPEYLEKIDISGYSLDVAVRIRNRILSDGVIYEELEGEAKELYDSYDRQIQRMIENDGSFKDQIVEHAKRKKKTYKVSLKSELTKEYEAQEPGTNNCWCCAGAGLLNHWTAKEKGRQKVSKEDLRSYRVEPLTAEELHLDEESYRKVLSDLEDFTTKNKDGKNVGNVYMLSDFFLKEAAKYPALKNTAVRKSVFSVGTAVKHVKGHTDKKTGQKQQDKNALANLTEKFKETVAKALENGSVLTLFSSGHYVTITGIQGDTLKVFDSLNRNKPGEERNESIPALFSEDATSLELTWLEKADPKAVTKEFKNLDFDEKTGAFRAKVHNFQENIAQREGVGAWKTLEEKEDDVSDLVMEGIYLPKQWSAEKEANVHQKADQNVIIEMGAIEEGNVIHEEKEKREEKTDTSAVMEEDLVLNAEETKEYLTLKEKNPEFLAKTYLIAKTMERCAMTNNDPTLKKPFEAAMDKSTVKWKNKSAMTMARTVGSMLRPVRYNEDGTFSEEEKANYDWNKKWVESWIKNDKKTREAMISEELPHLMDGLQLPTPEELEKGWIEQHLQPGKFEALYRMSTKCLGLSDLAAEHASVDKYLKKHSAFNAKYKLFRELSTLLSVYLQANYGIQQIMPVERSAQKRDPRMIEAFKESLGMMIASYRKTYEEGAGKIVEEDLAANKKALAEKSRKELKNLKKTNKNLTERGYQVGVEAVQGRMLYDDPKLVKSFERAVKKKVFKNSNFATITRTAAPLLHYVHYGENFSVPLSEKEEDAWNLRWIKAWEEDDFDERERMIEKDLPHVFDNLSFPKPEELVQWGEKLVKSGNIFKISDALFRGLGIDNLKNEHPSVMKYIEEHPEFSVKNQLSAPLSNYIISLVKIKLGVNIEKPGMGLSGLKEPISKQDMEMAQIMVTGMADEYKNVYNKLNAKAVLKH